MKKHYRILSTLVLVVGVLSGIVGFARAQGAEPPDNLTLGGSMGTAFTYQGQLKQNGNSVNAHCDFQFALYAAETGGAPIGNQPANDVSVSNGVFSTQIDFGASAFAGQALWLEISVSCPTGSGIFTPLTPRQPITPTPYALYASSAWNLQGNPGTSPGTNFVGTTDNHALEFKVNNARVFRLEPNPTSPNLIGGYSGNWVTAGAYGATIGGGGASGYLNRVTDHYGTVSGGFNNQAGDNSGTAGDKPYATIGGGGYNIASNWFATVPGGDSNQATGDHATVGGGGFNAATAYAATVGGGSHNIASGAGAFVGGGGYDGNINTGNTAVGNASTIGGGLGNSILDAGIYATIGGGYQNIANISLATIGGGWSNTASGAGAFVGGGGYDGIALKGNVAGGNASTIGGGLGNSIPDTGTYTTIGGGVKNVASGYAAAIGGGISNTVLITGGVATIGGGYGNIASGTGAFIGGGGYDGNEYHSNIASGNASTIGGGTGNTASGLGAIIGGGLGNNAATWYTTVGGGVGNYAGNSYATVGGGSWNRANGGSATVCGGENNKADGSSSTVGGGYQNRAEGSSATVPGGSSNLAHGNFSFAAGNRASAWNQGSFVWADSTAATFTTTRNDQFIVRANGGVGINTNSPFTNTLTISGNGLRVATDGTTFKRVESGTATLGSYGGTGVSTYTISFPAAFSSTPAVIVTPRGEDYNDMFIVTTRSISTTQFIVNVYRVDNGGGGWSQNLKLDWIAWE